MRYVVFALLLMLPGAAGYSSVRAAPYAQSYQQKLVVPYYSASYYDPIANELAQLRRELQELRDVIASVEDARQVSGGIQGVFGRRCASCHTRSSAAVKGDGYVLLEDDGSLAKLTPTDWRLIDLVSVHGDKMPKTGPKLSPAEKNVIQRRK